MCRRDVEQRLDVTVEIASRYRLPQQVTLGRRFTGWWTDLIGEVLQHLGRAPGGRLSRAVRTASDRSSHA